jgi:hypothetical protein
MSNVNHNLSKFVTIHKEGLVPFGTLLVAPETRLQDERRCRQLVWNLSPDSLHPDGKHFFYDFLGYNIFYYTPEELIISDEPGAEPIHLFAPNDDLQKWYHVYDQAINSVLHTREWWQIPVT